MKIYKNFLPKELFETLKDNMMGDNMFEMIVVILQWSTVISAQALFAIAARAQTLSYIAA